MIQTPDGIGVFVYKNYTVLRISTFEPTAIEQGSVQLSGILYGIKLALASALQACSYLIDQYAQINEKYVCRITKLKS